MNFNKLSLTEKFGQTILLGLDTYEINDEIVRIIEDYKIGGIVSKGNKIGSKLGIKTANIRLEQNDFIMKKGVYKCYAIIDNEKYLAICNIGYSPTIIDNEDLRLEVHILDFDKDLYGKFMLVEFVDFIRDEIKFNNIDELKMQILKDIEEVKK